jgi:hypothetical protein
VVKETFSLLADLRLHVNAIHPPIDTLPKDKDERRKLFEDRVIAAAAPYNAFLQKLEAYMPFIPASIYEEYNECAKMAKLELTFSSDDLRGTLPYVWKEALERSEKLNASYHRAADAIRAHFNTLVVTS